VEKNSFGLTRKTNLQLYAKNIKIIKYKKKSFSKDPEDFPRLLLQFGPADGRVGDLPGPPRSKTR
jgi:hypothetical protein